MTDHHYTQQPKKTDITVKKQTTPTQTTPKMQLPSSHPMAIIQRARINPKSLTHVDVMQLQRTIGNRAVGRLLSEIGLITSKDKQAPPVQMQKIPEEEKEPLQGKVTKTVQRQTTTNEKTIQMMRFNKKGEPSIFGSYDTAKSEEFKLWIQTLDLGTLRSIVAQLAKKGKRDEKEDEAFYAVREEYVRKKQLDLAEKRAPSLSEEQLEKVQGWDEEGIGASEDDREQTENDRILAGAYRLIAETQLQINAHEKQLQQAYEEADEQMRKMQAISDAIQAGIAGIPSMSGTGDEELERELEELELESELEQLTESSKEDEAKPKVASVPLLEPPDEDKASDQKISWFKKKVVL